MNAAMQQKMADALNAVGREEGLGFVITPHRSGKFIVEVAGLNAEGKAVPAAEREWNRLATMYGFQKDDLGKKFVSNGKQFEITGLNSGRTKYPVSGKRVVDGKGYKFTLSQVLRALGRREPSPWETYR